MAGLEAYRADARWGGEYRPGERGDEDEEQRLRTHGLVWFGADHATCDSSRRIRAEVAQQLKAGPDGVSERWRARQSRTKMQRVHHWVLSVMAFAYLAAAVGWLRTARAALDRARGLAHQGRPADQWRTLAAKDAVGSLLFFGLAAVTAVEAAQGPLTIADVLLVLGVGPTALSLALGRRFERVSAQVEAIEDLAYRRAAQAAQRDVFADRFAERLASAEVSAVPGVRLRSLYEPVEGTLGGDFVGVGAVDGRLDVVVGDVTGHGFDAALDAMRLKDLLLAELRAGESPAHALAVGNAFLCSETVSESFATAFVAQYEAGVVRYANAGHPPALMVGAHSERPLPPTGPLLGATPNANFDHAEVLLPAGQRLVAFTDGLIEAYGPAGGLETAKIAAMVRSGGIDNLHTAIRTARHEPVRDDIAVLELLRLASTEPSVGTSSDLPEDRTTE